MKLGKVKHIPHEIVFIDLVFQCLIEDFLIFQSRVSPSKFQCLIKENFIFQTRVLKFNGLLVVW